MDCDYQAVSAQLHKEAICDTFIGGIFSNEIRQCLLEDSNLTLQVAFEKACSLETTQRNAESYRFVSPSAKHIAKVQSCAEDKKLEDLDCSHLEDYSTATAEKCIFCRNSRHPRKSFVLLTIKFFLNAPNADIFRECVGLSKLRKTKLVQLLR